MVFIQANLILFLREETAQPSLPDNKLQILRLQNWSKAGFFRKKSNQFFDGLCLLSLKSLGFSLTENTLQIGGEKTWAETTKT